MGVNKKAKKTFAPKFAKPKQMKPTDYHSSSSDEEEEEEEETVQIQTTGADRDEGRLSDDSEHNFSDDEEEEASDDEEEEVADDEEEEVAEDEEEEEAQEVVAAVSNRNPTNSASDDEEEADDDDDDADGEEEDDDDDASADEEAGNADWAKSLAKILKQEKPKNKKITALSKAKKTADILEAREKAKAIGFAIDGEIKEEKPDPEALEAELLAAAEQKRRKRAAFNLRIKPTLMDRERERAFKKIATKGVVQLFNAVRTQQKDLSEKLEQAGRLDHRRDAVLNNINKRKFLDVLMGGKRAKSENVDNLVKDELKEESDDDDDDAVYNDGLPKNSIWSVLKEDFLSNKKMSHWDKDEEDEGPVHTDDEQDDDSD